MRLEYGFILSPGIAVQLIHESGSHETASRLPAYNVVSEREAFRSEIFGSCELPARLLLVQSDDEG